MTVRELLETALKIEEEGEKFYETLAKKVKNDEYRGFFEKMAREEEKHAERFKCLASKFEEEIYVDSDEAVLYLKSYTEGRVFPQIEDMMKWIEERNFEEIVEYSIIIEKESIIFYTEIKAWLRDERTRKLIDAIIDEEREHIRTLVLMREAK
ncbi:MAG: ferritin family protein [Thermotogaceae bacterium]|nr:ferritin family protein [Thermotogaceae bacterium]